LRKRSRSFYHAKRLNTFQCECGKHLRRENLLIL
jgi:hypothetical protein